MVSSRKKASSSSRSRSPRLNRSPGVNLRNDRNGCCSEPKDGYLHLRPVKPHSSGEGSPYAPKDWPNPGDNWGWRVGKRVSATGYFADRFLYPPRRLQKTNYPPYLSSKASVERFIQAEFPGASVNAFFASFSWKVPAKITAHSKLKPSSVCLEFTSPEEADRVENEVVEVRSKNPSKRKRRAGRLLATYRRRTRQSFKEIFSSSRNNNGGIIDLCSLNETPASMSTSGDLEDSSCSETNQVSSPDIIASSHHNGIANWHSDATDRKLDPETPQKYLVEEIDEDFETYLNSLDVVLAPPDLETMPSGCTEQHTPGEHEIAESRKKLSSLLIMDFPSLASSENLPHMAALASTIQADPSLTVDQLIKLKLIEEIPLIGKAFKESRETLEKCNKFFADLGTNKARVSSLKEEFKELKEKTSKLQEEIDSSASVLEDIDNQIAQLHSRRDEISSIIETKKKANAELISAQNIVANSIPMLVREIKEAYSATSEWEMKRITAARRESEILAKFASLKGYSL